MRETGARTFANWLPPDATHDVAKILGDRSRLLRGQVSSLELLQSTKHAKLVELLCRWEWLHGPHSHSCELTVDGRFYAALGVDSLSRVVAQSVGVLFPRVERFQRADHGVSIGRAKVWLNVKRRGGNRAFYDFPVLCRVGDHTVSSFRSRPVGARDDSSPSA